MPEWRSGRFQKSLQEQRKSEQLSVLPFVLTHGIARTTEWKKLLKQLYREGMSAARVIKCIVLRNPSKTKGTARHAVPKLLLIREIYFFGFFLDPKLVSTVDPMLASRSFALCAFGPLGAISRYFWKASA